MDYEQKYKHALDLAKQVHDTTISKQQKENIEIIFPELKESEGERIRKEILKYFQQFENEELRGVNISDWIAWLEKQGSEPNWCHHKVDLSNCSEEYRKAYYDGWNNCNMQHSQREIQIGEFVGCVACKYQDECNSNQFGQGCEKGEKV